MVGVARRQRQANFLSLAPRESHPPAPKWGQWTRHLHRQLNHNLLIKQETEKARARTATQSRLLRTLYRNVIMVTYALITLIKLYELLYTHSNEGACRGRRSEETKTGALPVSGSSRKPSISAVVGTMDLPLT